MIQGILDKRQRVVERIASSMGIGQFDTVTLILLVDPLTEIEIVKDKDFRPEMSPNPQYIGTIYGCKVAVIPMATSLCDIVIKFKE